MGMNSPDVHLLDYACKQVERELKLWCALASQQTVGTEITTRLRDCGRLGSIQVGGNLGYYIDGADIRVVVQTLQIAYVWPDAADEDDSVPMCYRYKLDSDTGDVLIDTSARNNLPNQVYASVIKALMGKTSILNALFTVERVGTDMPLYVVARQEGKVLEPYCDAVFSDRVAGTLPLKSL